MPTHNRAKYIMQSINSILAQTYTDYEIIVIDDNSTDNTKEALKIYEGKIRYFFRGGHGAAASRNFGISQAQGEYIAFLDDDDLWLPQHLEINVSILEKNPAIAFVCGDAHVINEHGEMKKTLIKPPELTETFETLLEGNFVLNLTSTIRKKIFLDYGGYDQKLVNKEDYDLWLRVAKNYKFKHSGQISALYREHGHQLTSRLEAGLKDHQKILAKPEIIQGVSFFLKHRAFARIYYRFGKDFLKEGKLREAGACFIRAILHCPWIGKYYWPEETKKMRFSLPYRLMRLYWLGPYLWIKGVLDKK